MELDPPDPSNNPHLRNELQRGKSKADVRFEDGPDTKKARTIASLQNLALKAVPFEQYLADIPDAVLQSATNTPFGRPPPISLPPDDPEARLSAYWSTSYYEHGEIDIDYYHFYWMIPSSNSLSEMWGDDNGNWANRQAALGMPPTGFEHAREEGPWQLPMGPTKFCSIM